nr:hypothetical protein [Tanacetum cinerariifolium]
KCLFNIINDLPTVFDVVALSSKKQPAEKFARGSESQLKYEKMQGNDEEDELEEKDKDEHRDTASYVFCMEAQEQDDSRFEGWCKDGTQEQDDSRFEGWCKDESKDEDLITRISYNTRGVIGSGYRASYVFCMEAQEQDDSRFEGWCKDGSKDEDLITRISCNARGVIGSGYRFVGFIKSG